ncbi:unnamed protein product [Didymodactylos carnosus]|uniref:Uncharacterized protein n=1 Tax=Didymodactylos carnosus TaxID=1234261 RepID=A0A813RCE5_9BILA|nr:unnamed protein product [Didymodactylos carnosus]CAF3565587.1 unnamed protein product [Didymodactylos carnosus]
MVSFLTALIDNHNYSLDVGSMANPITSVNGPVARSTKQPKNPENTTTVTFATQGVVHTVDLFSFLFILTICGQLISSSMKFLKFLNLYTQFYSCSCEHGPYTRPDNAELKFTQVQTPAPNLETNILAWHDEMFYFTFLGINDITTHRNTEITLTTLIERLLPYVPKLKHLVINELCFDQDLRRSRSPTIYKTLTYSSSSNSIKFKTY